MSHRYHLEPLARALGITLGTTGGHHTDDTIDTLAQLAERLGITHRHAQRLHQHGLTDHQADTYAIRTGHHPAYIWPDEWLANTPTDDEDPLDDHETPGPIGQPILTCVHGASPVQAALFMVPEVPGG